MQFEVEGGESPSSATAQAPPLHLLLDLHVPLRTLGPLLGSRREAGRDDHPDPAREEAEQDARPGMALLLDCERADDGVLVISFIASVIDQEEPSELTARW